jgi:hypothetical protein
MTCDFPPTDHMNHHTLATYCFATLLISIPLAHAREVAPVPDLTKPEVMAKVDRKDSTYNLGPTGLRGFIHVSRRPSDGPNGTMTDESRQILITVASAPADRVLKVDDVILGVAWGNSNFEIPVFSIDARKAFGNAITQAEKKENGGVLRVKRWRSGRVADVSITLPIMGTYAEGAPYECTKSTTILSNARSYYVGKLMANPGFLTRGTVWSTPIHALAFLSAVRPEDENYAAVRAKVQEYARSISNPTFTPYDGCMWTIGHQGLFLAEYYLATGDAEVLPGLRAYLDKFAISMSSYGTCNHRPALPRKDGTGRFSVRGYGAVNSAAIPANLAIVMLKKALLKAGEQVKPEVDVAIGRAANFYAWYTNKGSIPYGEHHAYVQGHSSNGKNGAAAMLFSQIDGREKECEYFTRSSIASFNGREYGHTGQGFSYLWEGMASNIGGPLAVASYFKPIRWHLDLSRRSDGSFAYDGQEQYGGGSTSDGTYLGRSDYSGLEATAIYLLTYSLPYKQLRITGRDANPVHLLTKEKVENAVAAGHFTMRKEQLTVPQLLAGLREYDPTVRKESAEESSKRKLDDAQLKTLRSMLSDSDANARRSACEALSLRNDTVSIDAICRLLDKSVEPEPWVRAAAASALRNYGDAAKPQVSAMLTAYVRNAEDPDKIDWNDPLQAGNGELSFSLFYCQPGLDYYTFKDTVVEAGKELLHPALSVGIRHPDSAVRSVVSKFLFQKASAEDILAIPNEVTDLILNDSQCDRMWSDESRTNGARTLEKHKFHELLPVAVKMSSRTQEFWHDGTSENAIRIIATYGDAARWALPILRNSLSYWDPKASQNHKLLLETIATVEAATTSPEFRNLKTVANKQVLSTAIGTPLPITLTGKSPRDAAVSLEIVNAPVHGMLTGNAPNLSYTPKARYSGPDHFTFRAKDDLTISEPATIAIIVGTPGNGLKAEYYADPDFKKQVLTRTDAQVDFDWSQAPPDDSIQTSNFGVKWTGSILIPETGTYTFSALGSDRVTLYIDAVKVIQHEGAQPTRWLDGKPINLKQGQKLEIGLAYGNSSGSPIARLKWHGPSIAGTAGSIIPSEYLSDSAQ